MLHIHQRGAAEIEEKADADPREFLLDLRAGEEDREAPLELSVRYFACDDANTFCIPVDQKYTIYLERDRDGGSVMRRGDPSRRGRRPAPAAGSSR